MHLIILPGNSKKYNEGWLYESKKEFEGIFETSIIHYYKHWKENLDTIDLDYEVEKLTEETKDLDKYVIYAKSAGTVVTIRALEQELINPEKIVFAGSPFQWAVENDPEFKEKFNKINVPTLFIQQTEDPFFKYEKLEKFLNKNPLKNYRLIEIIGDNHAYDNYKNIKEMIKDFVFENN